MSHQVIITFDIDEIRVQENAEKEAGRQIAREVIDSTFGNSYNRDALLHKYVESVIREMLEPNRDAIIKEAIQDVVENMHRTKAVRGMLTKAMDEEQ